MNQPLTEVIANYEGLLVVCFCGAGSAEETALKQGAQDLTACLPSREKALFMEVCLTSWTDVAADFGIHGAPAVAVFRQGRLILKSLGAQGAHTLKDRLLAIL